MIHKVLTAWAMMLGFNLFFLGLNISRGELGWAAFGSMGTICGVLLVVGECREILNKKPKECVEPASKRGGGE